jgi:putative transposase
MSSSCQMLKISRQAVYQHSRRQQHKSSQEQDVLDSIRPLRQLMPRVGARKLLEHLPVLGVGRDRLLEILRKHGLLVKRRRRYIITTHSDHGLAVWPNLLRHVTPETPNAVWVADQTYIRLRRGFCYLSLVTDLYSRRIVGYNLHPSLESTGPLKALRMALATVLNPQGLIHHSDRGKQYASDDYVKELKRYAIQISMTAPRRPDQNAVAERVNGILKDEFYLDATFNSFTEAQELIIQSIYIYNNIRLHTSLGMVTPALKHAA